LVKQLHFLNPNNQAPYTDLARAQWSTMVVLLLMGKWIICALPHQNVLQAFIQGATFWDI